MFNRDKKLRSFLFWLTVLFYHKIIHSNFIIACSANGIEISCKLKNKNNRTIKIQIIMIHIENFFLILSFRLQITNVLLIFRHNIQIIYFQWFQDFQGFNRKLKNFIKSIFGCKKMLSSFLLNKIALLALHYSSNAT